MMDKLKGHTIQQWFADFIGALQDSRELVVGEPEMADPSALWQRRTAQSGSRFH